MKLLSNKFAEKIRAAIVLFWVIVAGNLFISCTNDIVDHPDDPKGMLLSGISIPATINAEKGEEVSITGKGFQVGDSIFFILSSNNEVNYSSTIITVTKTTAQFLLPEQITSASYKLVVSRAKEQLTLGTSTINVTLNTTIPDIQGMTVKGIVYSNGVGIPGVVVSDGYVVTTTNNDGVYYLPSEKENGYVFISVPGNYEVVTSGQAPQFYQLLGSSASVVEQKDFSLIKSDNSNHAVIAMADWHLANRNNDLSQFTNNVLPDINATIADLEAKGIKVYGLTLGDLTWDYYWYSNSFGINNYVQYMNMVNCPVFNTIGNHDNDPYVTTDLLGELKYKIFLGPTYYSFNLGKVHYVVLDNMIWENDGGSEGNVGNRNYTDFVTQNQLDWLVNDLAAITDKNTPIVVAMHVPLYKRPTIDTSGKQNDPAFNIINGNKLLEVMGDFSEVHFLTGHTHSNYTVENGNHIEHNIGAICATWWWTNKNGYSGNHIAKEGSPGGYGVFEMNDANIEWYFKGAGYNKDYQFRAYDLNTVHITAAEFAPKVTEDEMAVYADEYAKVNSGNEILVNVWGYEPEWSVEISEAGIALEVSRVNAKDPLHIISYEAFRINAGATPTSTFVTGRTPNIFKARATSATSTINIKVTDRFGNIYTESMKRPKAFGLTIE